MRQKHQRKQQVPKKLSWKGVVVVVALAIVGATILARSFAAGPATITLDPTSGSHALNTNFSVTVYEDSSSDPVNFVQADLNYDQSKLQFVSLDTNGSAFDGQASQSGGNGLVSIARFRTEGNTLVGNQKIAVVNFKAVAGTGTTAISFAKSSYLVHAGNHTDIWNGVTTGGTFTLTTSGGSSGGGSGSNGGSSGGGSTSTPPPTSSGSSSSNPSNKNSSKTGSSSKPPTATTTPGTSAPSSDSTSTTQETPTPDSSTKTSTASKKVAASNLTGLPAIQKMWVIYFVGILVVGGAGWWLIQWIQSRRFVPNHQSASGDAKAFVGGETPFPSAGGMSSVIKPSETPPLEKSKVIPAAPSPAVSVAPTETVPPKPTPAAAAQTSSPNPATTQQQTPPPTPLPKPPAQN